MHGAWYILRWAWSAILVAYLLLYIVAGKRLGGSAKKRSGTTFWVIAALAAVRMSIRFVLGFGLAYRVAVLFAGIAAGFAALDLARMLVEQSRVDRPTGTDDESVQSLRLS